MDGHGSAASVVSSGLGLPRPGHGEAIGVLVRRGRGRPRKIRSQPSVENPPATARRRGRPPKVAGAAATAAGAGADGAHGHDPSKADGLLDDVAGAAGPSSPPDANFANWLRSPSNFKKVVPSLRITIQDAEVLALPHGISWFTAPTPVDIHVPHCVIHAQAMVTVTVTGVEPVDNTGGKTES